MVFDDGSKDLINRGRQNHIKNEKMPLKTVWNIVFTSFWMLHCTKIFQLI